MEFKEQLKQNKNSSVWEMDLIYCLNSAMILLRYCLFRFVWGDTTLSFCLLDINKASIHHPLLKLLQNSSQLFTMFSPPLDDKSRRGLCLVHSWIPHTQHSTCRVVHTQCGNTQCVLKWKNSSDGVRSICWKAKILKEKLSWFGWWTILRLLRL